MDRAKRDDPREPVPEKREPRDNRLVEPEPEVDVVEPNPPHTSTGPLTSPKFGSAGSGGAELEPGPPRP